MYNAAFLSMHGKVFELSDTGSSGLQLFKLVNPSHFEPKYC